MELKEYLKIFRENIRLFSLVVFLVVAGVFAYFSLRPIAYSTSLVLNITRSGVQKTDGYRYDNFYRLQADEKFAETVVEWLKSPRTAVDVYSKAGVSHDSMSLRQLARIFSPEKRSSQMVAVSFAAPSEGSAREISDALVAVISRDTEALNDKQGEEIWFKIAAQEPVIVRKDIGTAMVLLASLAAGIFLGFWIVMFRHYLK